MWYNLSKVQHMFPLTNLYISKTVPAFCYMDKFYRRAKVFWNLFLFPVHPELLSTLPRVQSNTCTPPGSTPFSDMIDRRRKILEQFLKILQNTCTTLDKGFLKILFFLPALQYTLLIHDWQGTNTRIKVLVKQNSKKPQSTCSTGPAPHQQHYKK